jgi:hypothetical protein
VEVGISGLSSEFDEPPGLDQEGGARLSTPVGEAAIEIALDQRLFGPNERLSFRLMNRGQVELLTGRAFHVECWNRQAWIVVPASSAEGFVPAITDEGWLLEPGGNTQTQRWPFPGMTVGTGWYRIVKPARFEGSRHGLPNQKLLARARFRVGSEPRSDPSP